jgi:hypothetical protein
MLIQGNIDEYLHFLVHIHKFYFFIDTAPQRHNTENSKQIFPEKGLWGLSANIHVHVSESDLYISMIRLPIMLQEICGPILGIYKSLTDTRMWK